MYSRASSRENTTGGGNILRQNRDSTFSFKVIIVKDELSQLLLFTCLSLQLRKISREVPDGLIPADAFSHL